jgi:hypothetical protein
MGIAAFPHDLRTSSKAVSTGERRGNPTKEHHVQKNQQGQGNQQNAQAGNDAKKGSNEQQSQSGKQDQQGGHGKLTPSGGSNQQNQSGGSRDQQGSNVKPDPGQAQSRSAQPSQQGGDHGNRSDKQR